MRHMWMLLIPALRSPPRSQRYATIPRALGITRLKGSRRTPRGESLSDRWTARERREKGPKGCTVDGPGDGPTWIDLSVYGSPSSSSLGLCPVFYPVCLFSYADAEGRTFKCLLSFFEIFASRLSSILLTRSLHARGSSCGILDLAECCEFRLALPVMHLKISSSSSLSLCRTMFSILSSVSVDVQLSHVLETVQLSAFHFFEILASRLSSAFTWSLDCGPSWISQTNVFADLIS